MSASKPRPEAEIIEWSELTEDQLCAIQQTHLRFCSMATEADKTPPRTTSRRTAFDMFLPHIDEKRGNHVVLIDGGRGTGKTVVMLRLLSEWSAAVRQAERTDPAKDEYGAILVKANDPIVPLGVLDLQALSPKAMLGLHLTGHLQRVVEAIEFHAPQSAKHAPWAQTESAELASRKAWRKFLRAAAVAWDGNLKERQGKIDPEAYVIELEQAERERLEIGGTFRAFVDALVDEYHVHFRRERRPFFVITIDDADLNPQRTMEIFELIRVLWHPRVGFLIAGDGDLFKTVLEEHFKQAIETPQLYGTGSFGGGPVRAYFEHAEETKRLARDAYQKAIPPAQRYPTGLQPTERYERIADALAEVHTRSSTSSFKLEMRDYFVHDAELKNALPARIRDLIDLAGDIQREKPSPIRLAWKLWQEAWDRADLPRNVRDKEFVQFKQTRASELLQFSNELKWTPEPTEQRTLKLRGDIHVVVNADVRFAFSDDKFQLPLSLISAYQLALEVAAREKAYSGISPVLAAMKPRPEIIRVEFLSSGIPAGVAMWCLPLWTSFREYRLFFNTWRRIVYDTFSQNDGAVGLDLLARQYLDLCLNSATPNLAENEAQIEIAMSPEGQTTWASLAARVVKVIRRDSLHRSEMVRMWVTTQACSLAAPEYGLSAAAANAWLDALRNAFGEDWERRREMLKSNRALNSENIQTGEIDERFSEYQWADVIEMRSATVARRRFDAARQELIRVLNSIPLATPALQRVGGNSGTLSHYATPHRVQLLAAASPEQLQRLAEATSSIATNIQGTEHRALKRLWDAAVPQNSLEYTCLHWDPGSMRISLKPDLAFELKSADVPLGDASQLDYPGTGSFAFRRLIAGWSPESKKNLTPVSDFLLRIAWDTIADGNDPSVDRTASKTVSTTWHGAVFSLGGWNAEIFWPMPDWPALLDWELAVDAWNMQITEAQKLVIVGAHKTTQNMVDTVAFWFIVAAKDFGISPRTLQIPKSHDWSNLGRSLRFYSVAAAEKSARKEAYNDWSHRVVVMAAPESGLSPEAAWEFLAGLFDERNNQNPNKRDKANAPKLRRQHAIDCGIAPDQVDSILAQIDAVTPDHPWHKFFAPEKP